MMKQQWQPELLWIEAKLPWAIGKGRSNEGHGRVISSTCKLGELTWRNMKKIRSSYSIHQWRYETEKHPCLPFPFLTPIASPIEWSSWRTDSAQDVRNRPVKSGVFHHSKSRHTPHSATHTVRALYSPCLRSPMLMRCADGFNNIVPHDYRSYNYTVPISPPAGPGYQK